MDDIDLVTYLATHGAHGDLVRWGFVTELAPSQYQVVDPPTIIEALRTGKLVGKHALLAAGLLLQCKHPKGFWYAETPEDLIERIREDQPL